LKNHVRKSFVKVLALVVGMACTQSVPAQTFKRVNVKGGAALAQVSSGGASVWARASNGNPYILQGKQFVLANSIFLCQIAVGGGNAFQADAVWGLDCSGNIYRAAKSRATWVFSPAPGVLDFIAVGAGYNDSCHPYEVWGLHSASIYRYNFCIQNWDFVPGSLATLAVGGGNTWGINASGSAFRFNLATLVFDLVPNQNSLSQITVGPNGVWAIGSDSANTVYGYDAEFSTFFTLWSGFRQIQAGGNGVWGGSFPTVERLEPSTSSFVQVPGAFVSISVGSGGGVWGTDSSGHAFAFSTP
jgi:hypothetical protein